MANTITATVIFDFKGKEMRPSTAFDLDDWVKRSNGEMPDFVSAAAGASQTGAYSYEREAMHSADIVFSNPTGMADRYYNYATKAFDFDGFRTNWLKNVYFSQLNLINQRHLGEELVEGSPQHLAMLDVLHLARKEVL